MRQYGIDLVEFQHLNMAAYRDQAGSAPAILREHNIEYKVWERYAAHARGSLESLYVRRCAPRVRAYEAKMAPTFARCITVSKADARHLTSIAPTARVESIPSGVDMEYFHPAPEIPEEPCRMVLTGSFEWKPKQHNLRVLLTEIMPRIQARLPQAKLDVVGKGVPEDLCKLAASMPAVAVTGTVPDVRPYVWRSSLVLNYLESGEELPSRSWRQWPCVNPCSRIPWDVRESRSTTATTCFLPMVRWSSRTQLRICWKTQPPGAIWRRTHITRRRRSTVGLCLRTDFEIATKQ